MLGTDDTKRKHFTDLLLAHRTMIYRVCYQHAGGNVELAHDMVQETALRLWRQQERLRPDSHPMQVKAWVYWTARSVAHTIRRSQRQAISLDRMEWEPHVEEVDPQGHRELLYKAIEMLSERDRAIATLYLEGYDFATIAQRVESTPEAVNKQMQRIRMKLKTIISNL